MSLNRRTVLMAGTAAASAALLPHGTSAAPANESPLDAEHVFGRGVTGPLVYRDSEPRTAEQPAAATSATRQPHLLVVADPRGLSGLRLDDETIRAWRITGFRLTVVPALYEKESPIRVNPRYQPAYPPKDGYYDHPEDPNSRYLWRWIGCEAPNLVIELQSGDTPSWWLGPLQQLARFVQLPRGLNATVLDSVPETSLAAALNKHRPADVGTIPAVTLRCSQRQLASQLSGFADILRENDLPKPSPAREELTRREARSTEEVARQLAQVYGHHLKSLSYIPSLAVICRRRLAHRAADSATLQETEQLASELADRIERQPIKSGSEMSGLLLFSELAADQSAQHRDRWLALARRGADLAFDEKGKMLPIVPFHLEMSDSIFMGCSLLAAVGKLTGERRYFDACLNHLEAMQKHCLRADGIYRHSPLCEVAWGRGNGFAALGMAWSLRHLPTDHPGREFFASSLATLLKKLAALPGTMLHQVVDEPSSYREFTSSAMVSAAELIRRQYLAAQGKPAEKPLLPVEAVWNELKRRIAPDGGLIDVCTGTGKQKSLDDYFRRPAILGQDDRGGAMALLLATELLAADKRS